jgi:hypothetical protein
MDVKAKFESAYPAGASPFPPECADHLFSGRGGGKRRGAQIGGRGLRNRRKTSNQIGR